VACPRDSSDGRRLMRRQPTVLADDAATGTRRNLKRRRKPSPKIGSISPLRMSRLCNRPAMAGARRPNARRGDRQNPEPCIRTIAAQENARTGRPNGSVRSGTLPTRPHASGKSAAKAAGEITCQNACAKATHLTRRR